MLGQPCSEAFPHLAGGELDDAVMLVRKLELALRGHHAMALDAAYPAHLDGGIDTGDILPRLADNHRDPLARIGRAADDLLHALIRLHLAHAQAIGIGMLFSLHHPPDGESRKRFGRVDDFLHLKAEIRERFCDLVHARIRIEMILQPGKGEFHGVFPSDPRPRRSYLMP